MSRSRPCHCAPTRISRRQIDCGRDLAAETDVRTDILITCPPQLLATGGSINALYADPATGAVLTSAGNDSIWASLDHGQTWILRVAATHLFHRRPRPPTSRISGHTSSPIRHRFRTLRVSWSEKSSTDTI